MKPIIVFQSDFGLGGLVASMHGVCKTVDPTLEIDDLTHLVPAFDVRIASDNLQYTMPCWPKGTIFVSVIDPGVGTARKACVAKTGNGYFVVTPDNGTLSMIKEFYGIDEVREIDQSENYFHNTEYIDVFHGRDVFAYCAARLAAGLITFEQVGKKYPVSDIIMLPKYPCEIKNGWVRASAWGSSDGFGILLTNIRTIHFNKSGFDFENQVQITIRLEENVVFDQSVAYDKTFGCVPQGGLILHPEVDCFLGLAINQGNFCEQYGIKDGKTYTIDIKKL